MTSILKYISIFITFFNGFAIAQIESDIVAKTGSTVITLEEFKNRYEFMPHLNYSINNPAYLKKVFLYSLIAEKLWAMEAVELNYDTLEAFKYSIDNLEKFLIKDELYRDEVESKINITNEEILKGLTKVNKILEVKIITSRDSLEIFKISEIMNNADSVKTPSAIFDSILSLRNEYEIQEISTDVPFGRFREDIEDMLFKMEPGTISQPVQTSEGWFIVKVIGEEFDTSIKPSTEHAKNIVFNTIKERRIQKISGAFLDNIIGGRNVTADGKIFENICKNLEEVLMEKDTLPDVYELTSTDISYFLQKINESVLSGEFIRFEENPLSAKDFLYYLFYQKIVFNSQQPQIVKAVLNKAVKQFIEDEMIVREGIKRELHNRENIKKDLKIWKDYYLAQLIMGSYSDSIKISDNEILNYYHKIKKSPGSYVQVNIAEILTDDLDNVEKIFNELEQGKDFRELAASYTQREWTKKRGGEFGYFPVEEGNEIGRIAAEMNLGEIYGPLKVPEGYSLFKLIGKKEIPDSLIESFDEKKDLLKTQLSIQKLTRLVTDKTINLANKYDVKIMEQLLNSTELIELNTFTYRLIGFGGKIAAFPITMPMFEWYEKFIDEKVNP